MNLLELSEQEIIRRNSMEQLRQMGIEPYPAAEYVTNAFSKEIKETFKDDAEPRPGKYRRPYHEPSYHG